MTDAYQLKEPQITYLYGPLAVIIAGNIFFFILTTVQLYRSNIDSHVSSDETGAK